MVSIIKNQLLKHLSRYTKNLSPDKVNLSAFRGEGDLSNLQLDENVLTELLELPAWLRLTSAWCNHVSFRISWTKLKSTPITLTLDEVNITIETCEIARSGTPTTGFSSIAIPQGKYSFIQKVIDGITIVVNTVNVNLKSPAFTASVQMSRIRVESRTPKWLPGDLRVTRIKDPSRGLVLIFKELSWQTLRIEASSTQDQSLTPLRLLTNQARCRITVKKKLSDCSIIASRLVLILDDLLWVLTDSQLKAALYFVDSLSGLIKASNSVVQRVKAQRKLETLPEYQAQLAQSSRTPDIQQLTAAQRIFNIYDAKETSYHFFSQRIDLHLCDDAGVGRSSHPNLQEGGALQISVQGFQVDYYPYHLAKADRSHWPKYKEASIPPALWLQQSLNTFRESVLNLAQANKPPVHPSLERTTNLGQHPQAAQRNAGASGPNASGSTPNTPGPQSASTSPVKKHVLDNLAKLMSVCVILKIEEFTLYRVTTGGNKQMPKEFITALSKRKKGDRDRYSLPPEMPTVHAEFTYFYYPGDSVFPLPPSKAFIHINPVLINFDLDSCLWFSSFMLNLHESLLQTNHVTSSLSSPSTSSSHAEEMEPPPNLMYMDVKVEVIMPRIVFEAVPGAPQQKDRPKSMQIQVSRFAMTNIREMGASRADLAQAISSLQNGSLVFGSGFPSKAGDMCIVTDRILSHIAAKDVTAGQPSSPLMQSAFSSLTRYALWSEPRDVWCMKLDPIWVDFYGTRSVGLNRAIPFVDAVPVTIWLHGRSDDDFLSNHLTKPIKNDISSKRNSNNSNLINSSDSLILSVSNLKQSLELDPMVSNLYKESSDNGSIKRNSTCHHPLIGDNVKKKLNDSEHRPINPPNDPVDSGADATKTADLHIIAHVSNLVSVQIDHYQYLFLLRLAEELTELTTFLSLDSKRILQAANIEKSIIVGCVIPQVEVSLVMPSQTPGKESSGGDGESVLPDSASLGDDLLTNGSGWPNSMDQTRNSNIFSSTDCPSPVATGVPDPQMAGLEFTNKSDILRHSVQIQSVPETSSDAISIETPSASSTIAAKGQQQQAQAKGRGGGGSDSVSFSKDINYGLSSMKKGFSNFMTSIDSALKTNMSDDMSDTLSVQSDLSSDSENYLMMLGETEKTADCMDVMFKLNPFSNDTSMKVAPIELASEVCEDPYLTNMSSPSEPSEASSLRRRDLVSMVTFRLTTVEVIRENVGNTSSIRLQVSAISCDECGAIPWDEFQNDQHKAKTKFGTRCRAWDIAPHNPGAPPCVAVRLEEELTLPADSFSVTDKKSIQSWFKRKLNVEVKNINLQLSMSTVVGLGDLAEDEVIPTPIPMEVMLENVKINLIEDRPPVNITSPGSLPVNLAIGRMFITRDAAGVFYLQPQDKSDPQTERSSSVTIAKRNDETVKKDRDREVLSLKLVMEQLKMDNDLLRKQLSSNEKIVETIKIKTRQENDVLRTTLMAAQDNVSTLLDEKRTLMDTIRSLQNQLTALSDVQMNATNGKR
ncbi:bridge-like lipid transfer protein family member 3B [Toxorhynchites rutilus septentrionalis]|uniref:bridge-like lipid transfer protein family member 3B n=1 Tax=Toxorhynchites rutilus septentrionalis TaxID=329112 RepID=UPI00247AE17D|nr:bridge-like lipid transfer protein family member 3B [Toxorhynchites rutilus septentrionalis]